MIKEPLLKYQICQVTQICPSEVSDDHTNEQAGGGKKVQRRRAINQCAFLVFKLDLKYFAIYFNVLWSLTHFFIKSALFLKGLRLDSGQQKRKQKRNETQLW